MRFKLGMACLVFAAPACSSSASSGSPEAGADADGADAGDGDAAVCNTLANTGTPVTVVQVATDPPSAQGGTPVDGVYSLSNETIYTGSGGATGPTKTDRITIQIQGGAIQVSKDSSPTTSTYRLTTNGTSYTAAALCPPMIGDLAGSYTATATTFAATVGASGSGGGPPWVVETFTKE
ncbi:MAG TPA: hypothetical protein VKU41_29195 [Polyangiaceae bacterium]|nr:hypothetical protein [Polyangiaceae bacterium]